MNNIEDYLLGLEKTYSRATLSLEWDDLFQFERNYKYNFKLQEVKIRISFLSKVRLLIGNQVYKDKKGFRYCGVAEFAELDEINKRSFDTTQTMLFTEDLFNKFCVDYLKYSIKYLTIDFLERSIVSNSTHKLGNLAFEWMLECKQELLQNFKSIVEEESEKIV